MVTVKNSHTLVALVQDKPGVLNRISGMFRRRGFNISSLAVGRSELPDLSRMTFVVEGDDATVEQVTKQLYKLIDVVRVSDLSNEPIVAREMALIKVRATSQTRSEVMQIVDIFRANIIDVSPESLIIEVTGDEDKITSLNELLKSFGVQEVMRTGRVAMLRGAATQASPSNGTRRANTPQHYQDYEAIL
ncbi:MAG: acetolactate synthase small subunit [Chloroflexi bacterium]|nr:acetolactate synthase small subunit [Chloroflexota bacterium]MBI4198188.1 acetolactate synthase small subunit [Chloroflexota bacterium]